MNGLKIGKEKLMKWRSDPALWAREVLHWEAFEEQGRWLRRSIQDENYLVCGNRWGKTESNAVDHLHSCFFQVRDKKWIEDW